MKKWVKRVMYFLLFIVVFINIVAAFHAYKFTHFYDADTAPTARPEQMTAWEKVKVILTGVDYVKRPINETPAQAFENIDVETDEGLRLKGWYVPVENPLGTVILLHGHGGTRSGVVAEMKAFNSMGYNACAIDFRAHGQSGGNVSTIGYNETADLMAAYDFVKARGETRIILWGISLGAATIIKAMDDYPELNPERVILEMPFGTLEKAVEARLRMMNLPEQPFAALLTFWGGLQQGFWAFNHKPEDYAKELDVPVLLQWGRNDSRVSEEETSTILENIPVDDKRLVVYENSGHESLLKKEPAKWVTNVGAFLAK